MELGALASLYQVKKIISKRALIVLEKQFSKINFTYVAN